MKAANDKEVCVVCAGTLFGRQRKLKLIEQMGGQCSSCGYKRNFSALEFHHRVPSDKSFQLDMRSLANLDWSAILLEVDKYIRTASSSSGHFIVNDKAAYYKVNPWQSFKWPLSGKLRVTHLGLLLADPNIWH